MEREGVFVPETEREARDRYAAVGPAAQTVVRELARAMEFDEAEYRERVTGEVVETARDALFASMLEVCVGTRREYEDWLADTDREVHETGSENVERVVWHAPPFHEEATAATFHEERDAAVATLRRQAFGRLYRPLFERGGT
jgi:uncharacterized DUF497 family protein